MITGFNTDIEYEGTVYHVQTEDKGLNSPFVLSLVYVGGEIIASKRTSYEDLIASGFQEEVLNERLQRQHKLICAAIKAGRVEDLKRMGRGGDGAAADKAADKKSDAAQASPEADSAPETVVETKTPRVVAPKPKAEKTPALKLPAVKPSAKTKTNAAPPPAPVIKTRSVAPVIAEEENGLTLRWKNETELRSGDEAVLHFSLIRATRQGSVAVAGAPVTVKILGTHFRPVIIKTQTDRDGAATVRATIPKFNAGRAAMLIESSADGEDAALRRIIRQA